jgi:predicted MPP superfamily phosphohydrolase
MGRIRHSHYQIRRQAQEGQSKGRVRIAVLADLHNRVYRSDVPTLMAQIEAERCDMVLSAGDLVLMKGGHFATDQALRLLCGLAGKLPVYVANGNHETRMERLYASEYRRYEECLRKNHIICLHNRSEDVTISGLDLRITGLELDRRYFRNRYHKELSVGEIVRRVGPACRDRFQILLAHHPKYFPVYARWGADLTFSGHIHGGIVRLPLLGGVISPDPALFPHYDHGLYEEADARMIVSAGLGTHSINLRVNNPAELVITDIIFS